MVTRFAPGSGCILQLIIGFGIGSGVANGGAASRTSGKLDFSRPANSGLIAVLRRF